MFRIIKAGAGIGLTENLNYIKKAENGCYILCPEHDASGIVFEGVAYHLLGRAAMDELETVSLEQTDAGSEITKATEAGGIVFVTLAEAGSIDAETAAEHADLFAEWAFPVGYTVGRFAGITEPFTSAFRPILPKRIGHRTRLPACGAKRVIPLKNGPNGANRWERMTLIPRGQR
mgnify:FL=1